MKNGRIAVAALAAMLLATGAEATDFAGAIRDAGLDGEVVSACETSGCVQVFFNLRSAPDSLICCVMALPPAAKWDDRLWGFGNGGPGGKISPKSVLTQALRGSAAVHTDMGTSRRPATPTMIRDFGHVSTHLMTVAAKAIVQAHYGRPARRAYFKGGSTGGGQGFHEALRYPGDYDGIISMVPANTRMPLHIYFAWNERQRKDAHGKDLFSAAQLATVCQAGIEALADEQPPYARGKYLVDSLYTPERERKVLKRAVELDPSLDRPELLARLHRIFTGPVIGGRRIHAGVPFGADIAKGCGNQWMLYWWLPKGRAPWSATDAELLQWEQDYGPDCDAYTQDLAPFLKRGGKLLVCGGLEDSVVPVPSMVEWYEKTAATCGGPEKFADGCRFFLMPGYAHGPGRGMRNMGDLDSAIVGWVEKGKEPKTLTATMQDGTLMTVLPYRPQASGGFEVTK